MPKFPSLNQIVLSLLGVIAIPMINVWMYLSDEVECARWNDDCYEMVVSYPKYALWLAWLFGDWTTNWGIVRIFGVDGEYHGAQSIAAMQKEQDMRWVF